MEQESPALARPWPSASPRLRLSLSFWGFDHVSGGSMIQGLKPSKPS